MCVTCHGLALSVTVTVMVTPPGGGPDLLGSAAGPGTGGGMPMIIMMPVSRPGPGPSRAA